MEKRKLAVIPIVMLTGIACTPREVRHWKEWYAKDPEAALQFARDLPQERETREETSDESQREEVNSSQNTTGSSVWDRLAQCESGGNWNINTGNGYYGGLQFGMTAWRATGGNGRPDQSSRAEQIKRAEVLLDMQGWGAWPACSRKLGLR